MLEVSLLHPIPGVETLQSRLRTPLRIQTMNWETAWPDLLQFALRLEGPDVSDVGMTWLGSLMGMQALRAFSQAEISSLDGPAAFVKSAWENALLENVEVGIPWVLDARVLYYRRDLFEKAGIDEATAFQSPEQIYETLSRLQANGISTPWTVQTTENGLQFLAPWIWWYGGAFRSPDGTHITLTEPAAQHGILEYFKLRKFLAVEGTSLSPSQADGMFIQGKAAVAYSGDWLYRILREAKSPLLDRLGVAPLPGTPCVGGMYLVIWRYSTNERQAMNFIRYITGTEVQSQLAQSYNPPARIELYHQPPFTTDPVMKVIAHSILTGRCFRNFYRWAAVESRLNATFNQLWSDLITNPALDLTGEIERRILVLKQKLERTILA